MSEQELRTDLQHWAAEALVASGTEEALKILVQQLRDADPLVRQVAAKALNQIEEGPLLEKLVVLLNAPDSPIPTRHSKETEECLSLPRLRLAAYDMGTLNERERTHLQAHCPYCDKTLEMFHAHIRRSEEPSPAPAPSSNPDQECSASYPEIWNAVTTGIGRLVQHAKSVRARIAIALLPRLSVQSFATELEGDYDLEFSRAQIQGTYFHFDGAERLTLQQAAPPDSLLYVAILDAQGNPIWERFAILVAQGGANAPTQAQMALTSAPMPDGEERILCVMPVEATELSAQAAALLQQSFLAAHEEDPYAIESGSWRRWAERSQEIERAGQAFPMAIRDALEAIRIGNVALE